MNKKHSGLLIKPLNLIQVEFKIAKLKTPHAGTH